MANKTEHRKSVPGGSTIRIEAGPKGLFAANVRVLSSGEDDESFTTQKVVPGPAEFVVNAPEAYLVKVRLLFSKEGAAKLRVSIERPDGEQHSVPVVWDVPGKKNKLEFRSLIVQTA